MTLRFTNPLFFKKNTLLHPPLYDSHFTLIDDRFKFDRGQDPRSSQYNHR